MNTQLEKYLMQNSALIEIESFEECIEIFTLSGKLSSPFYYFRGLSKSNFDLLSTLDRFTDKGFEKELLLINQFKRISKNYLQSKSIPDTLFEWLALMQHYGMPTRLLDLTNSPYIALYFAVRDYDSNDDAAVWAINPSILHDASIQSLKRDNFPLKLEKLYQTYFPELIQDNYFKEIFLSGKYNAAFILEPTNSENRVFHQQGAFLVSSGANKTTEDVLTEILLSYIHTNEKKLNGGENKGFLDWNMVKVIIPEEIKKKIFRQLLAMNINSATLFPDIKGASDYVTEYIKTFDSWEFKQIKYENR